MKLFVMSGAVTTLVGCVAALPPPVPQLRPARPHISGGALLVDLQPTNKPLIVGAYDFELLARGEGRGCVKRKQGVTRYWVNVPQLESLASDPLTRQAIAAAAHDALSSMQEADSIVLTHVVTTSDGPDEVCAVIAGRGVRLTKARVAVPAAEPARESEEPEESASE